MGKNKNCILTGDKYVFIQEELFRFVSEKKR